MRFSPLTSFSWHTPVLTVLLLLIVGLADDVSPAAQGAPRPKLQAFDLRDVVLLDGPFKHATDQDRAYLLSLEPDRLLAWFRKEAGLAPKAAVYGGWESEKLAGHSLGHYLSACASMYRATNDVRFRDRITLHRRRVGRMPAGERRWLRRRDSGGEAALRGSRARRHSRESVRPERRSGHRSTPSTSSSPASATRTTSPDPTRRSAWPRSSPTGWTHTVAGLSEARRCRRCCAASTAA